MITQIESEFFQKCDTWFVLKEPDENLQYSENPNFQIGVWTNPDYFNIYHWKLQIEVTIPSIHEEFWTLVPELLSNVGIE